MIKAIIFDYGGVLSVNANLRLFGENYALKFGANPEKFNKLMINNWFQARVNKIDSELFWKNLSDFLKIEKEVLRKDFMDFFGFRYDVLELIKKLKKNYKLGLLSNQIEDWLEEVIEEHKLDEVFNVIVTSYESKLAKPDIAIFKETVKRLGVKPAECVYVDDLETNIPPAKKVGMKTILFRDFEQLKKELEPFVDIKNGR
ncbi:HAD family phosphatase [Candidatus Woesearchaeota archaeon]|nr:HAD family phosphatase [Candidatus Woesearchaeota archaeon]